MAKRFTDTNKWKNAWFRKLPVKMKVVWTYLCDNCDHAGIWPIDIEQMSFHLGEECSLQEIEIHLGHRVEILNDDKLFVKKFIEFQYGELNPSNNAHKSVLNILQKEGVFEGLMRGSQGAQDKDKDKEKDKETQQGGQIQKLIPSPPPLVEGPPQAKKFDDADDPHDADMRRSACAVLEHLNAVTGSRYRANTQANTEPILARMRDGYTVEDCVRVIDVKWAEWRGSDYEKYMRPQTLFRPSKFEGYVNQKPPTDPILEAIDVLESAPAIIRPERGEHRGSI